MSKLQTDVSVCLLTEVVYVVIFSVVIQLSFLIRLYFVIKSFPHEGGTARLINLMAVNLECEIFVLNDIFVSS